MIYNCTYSDWSGTSRENSPWRGARLEIDFNSYDKLEIYLTRSSSSRNTFMIELGNHEARKLYEKLKEQFEGD